MKQNCLADLNAGQVKSLFENKELWAILPVGSTEFHGPVGPYGTDTKVGEAISRYVAERIDSVLLPAIPYGHSPDHIEFAGTMHLSEEMLSGVVSDVFQGVRRHGLKRLLVVTGHWGNEKALYEFKKQAQQEDSAIQIEIVVVFKDHIQEEDCAGLFDGAECGGHGGAGEVSVALTAKPYLEPPDSDAFIKSYPLESRGGAESGWSGRPELASKEIGARIVRILGERIVEHIRSLG